MSVRCAPRLEILAIPGIPVIAPGDDLPSLIRDTLVRAEVALRPGDVVVVASKIVSRAEGRFVDLRTVTVSEQAAAMATEVDKEPELVQLILSETSRVSRAKPGVLIVRNRLGHVSANAAIDRSNAAPPGEEPGSWALVLPEDPDASARQIRDSLGADIGVVISDSFGRPFRVGTVGVAIGVAGLPPVFDQAGGQDLFGRALEHTITGLADQVAAAADLVAGQADEATPVTVVRGLSFTPVDRPVSDLLRDPDMDLYL